MHNLSGVAIRNFRSCADVAVPLALYTPLVGQNNCGKSNIIAAVEWMLRPYALGTSDFGNTGVPVVVSGSIAGLTEDHLRNLAPEHRTRIAPFCATGTLQIRRLQAAPGGGVKAITLEVRDPSVADGATDSAWKRNPTGIDAAIQALFPEPIHVAAMQDAAADVTSGKKDSTIGRLVASLVGTLEKAHGTHLTEALDGIRKRLGVSGAERAEELAAFDDGANANLSDLFPGLRVRLHFEPPTLADLFKAGTIKVFEGNAQHERGVDSLGHGAQRAIQMALIRYLASIARAGDEVTCTLLLIDEPELYLHPHAIEQVRLALLSLSNRGYQVVFSTHSPLMIGLEDVPTTVMVHRPTGTGTNVRKRIAEAWAEAVSEAPSQSRRLFEFGNASRVLFSNRLVIAEGETEQRILPVIYEVIRKRSLMSAGIALINTGGSGGVVKCMRLLAALDIPAVAIVDLDFAFRQSVKSGLLPVDDPDVTAFRQVVGEVKDVHGILIDTDGFPKRGGDYTAAEAFCCIAKEARSKPLIARLAARLLSSGIWLWDRGAIEEHLGIEGKNEDAWSEYSERLRRGPLDDAIADYVGVNRLVHWLEEGAKVAEQV